MASLNEQLYGKEFSDALEAFHDDLDKIEAKHLKWFESRPGKTDKEHDRLHNHYITNWTVNNVGISFGKTSELSQEIKDECLEAFKKRFEPLKKFKRPDSI